MRFRREKVYRPVRRAPVPHMKPIRKQEWDDDDFLELIGPGDPEPQAGDSNLP